MFIEDSRVTAVANADTNPKNPGCFYSVSTYSQSPSTVHVQSPFQNQDRSIYQRVSSAERDNKQSPSHGEPAITYGNSNDDDIPSFQYYHQSQVQLQPSRNSREIIHKIVRECSEEDQEDNRNRGGSIEHGRRNSSPVRSSSHDRRESLSSYQSRRSSVSSSHVPPPLNNSERLSSVRNLEAWSVPPPSQPKPRFRTAMLKIEPVLPFVNATDNFPASRLRNNVSYTTVNLTLRSPSAGSENKRFSPSLGATATGSVIVNTSSGCASSSFGVDGSLAATAGLEQPALCACGGMIRVPNKSSNTLTYSTYSSSRGGFEAQVQIQIGPNGGTISACRRRKENVALQQMNAGMSLIFTFNIYFLYFEAQADIPYLK
jgi:hypothetical protein